VIGQPPATAGPACSVTTLGRLEHPEQFADVIVRADGNRVVRLRDVARVELGARAYDTLGRIDGVPSALLVVYLSPDGNSVKVADALHALMDEVQKELPAGVGAVTIYDTSVFVKAAIEEVYKTLLEAMGLVILVVLVFLGGVRSTLIPIAAIPVSLVGTFLAMALFGFSISLPTLFGLVLAIGIVVTTRSWSSRTSNAITTELHLPPKGDTRAMTEVFGAVLGALAGADGGVPADGAMPGIQRPAVYRQFALTIAASTFFSALCALVSAPLAGVLLRTRTGQAQPVEARVRPRVGWLAGATRDSSSACCWPVALRSLARVLCCDGGDGLRGTRCPPGSSTRTAATSSPRSGCRMPPARSARSPSSRSASRSCARRTASTTSRRSRASR
jgi:multidrug efflux pump subunit AcrB